MQTGGRSVFNELLVWLAEAFRSEGRPDGGQAADAQTDYPVSSHSGEETYLVIAGTAKWTIDHGPHRARPPGSLVHHPAWTPHGRRTGREPFLGAWRWSGDLDLSSFKLSRWR